MFLCSIAPSPFPLIHTQAFRLPFVLLLTRQDAALTSPIRSACCAALSGPHRSAARWQGSRPSVSEETPPCPSRFLCRTRRPWVLRPPFDLWCCLCARACLFLCAPAPRTPQPLALLSHSQPESRGAGFGRRRGSRAHTEHSPESRGGWRAGPGLPTPPRLSATWASVLLHRVPHREI